MRFKTLRGPVRVNGFGLHTGQEVSVLLQPSEQLGLNFHRVDLAHSPAIPAGVDYVSTTVHATTLSHAGATLSTTEHLLAALWSQNFTHCSVAVNGPEIPILDGSALPWLEALDRAGGRELAGERPVYRLSKPVWWEGGGASVLGLPSATFRLSVAVDFGVPHAGPQVWDGEVNAQSFRQQLAPARTFTLEKWLEPLRAQGLIRGGSEENAIVLWEAGAPPTFRLDHELARHKALDALGDLALLLAPEGAQFCGHLIATRAGHGPHRAWIEACRAAGALTTHYD